MENFEFRNTKGNWEFLIFLDLHWKDTAAGLQNRGRGGNFSALIVVIPISVIVIIIPVVLIVFPAIIAVVLPAVITGIPVIVPVLIVSVTVHIRAVVGRLIVGGAWGCVWAGGA